MENAARRLRARLNEPGLIVAPGVYDGLSAELAAEAGFDVLYMTGSGVSMGVHGLPDVGLLTLTEMTEACARITAAVDLPVIADADTGYGNAVNVTRTVRAYIRAGAAAIHIEDQVAPKKCGFLAGQQIVPAEEMRLKLRAAAEARGEDDLVLIARTDARPALGLEEALRRARLYREAGADVIFFEGAEDAEELARIPREVDAPCLVNMGGKSTGTPADELERMGYRIAIYPGTMQGAALVAMREALAVLRERGEVASIADRIARYEDRFRLAGLERIQDLETKYLPKEES